jgi:hypothetical protein
MIASKPLLARAFLTDYIKQKSAKYQATNKGKMDAVETAITAAEKQVAHMVEAGKSEDDAQLRVLLKLNVAVGKALSALLNSDEGLKGAQPPGRPGGHLCVAQAEGRRATTVLIKEIGDRIVAAENQIAALASLTN